MNINIDLKEKLDKARLSIYLKEPYLGYVLQHIEIVIDNNIGTAGTDGITIIFNKVFLEGLTLKQTKFILLHELLHIILMHPSRRGYRQLSRFNIACDIVVNDTLEQYGYSDNNLSSIYGKMFDLDGCAHSAEVIYDLIPHQASQMSVDRLDLLPAAEFNKVRTRIGEILKDAVEKGYTTRSGLLENRIVNLYHDNSKPKAWLNLLEDYLQNTLPDYSYRRLDMRYPDVILPAYLQDIKSLQNVWFVIDVSKSMTDDNIRLIYKSMQETLSHFSGVSCSVSFFSKHVTPPRSYQEDDSLIEIFQSMSTSYGTDVHIIFESIPKFFKTEIPKLIIILTDGYCKYPDPSLAKNIPVIWLITSEAKNAPFGTSFHL